MNPYDPLIRAAMHSKWNRRLKFATLASIAFVAVVVAYQYQIGG